MDWTSPIGIIRRRREAAADWNTKAAQAGHGEVWTASYRTRRAVFGGRFTSYTAGPVRVLGDECPVEGYRGEKSLGEYNLGPRSGRVFATLDAVGDLLEPGDVAPTVRSGAAADLLTVPHRRMVTVEHRSDHPVCAGLRFVEIGLAGHVQDFHDGEGPGRYVGDSWVRLSEVTGVQW